VVCHPNCCSIVATKRQDEALSYQATFKRAPPREVIVFIVGGSTLEESKAVVEWNERNPHMRVVLGGTSLLNSHAFMHALGGGGPLPSEAAGPLL
jgi:vacuolar protein sorting-associated protein 45